MGRKAFRRGVTTTSTTLSDLGEIGDERFEGGKNYRLVYTVVSHIAKGIVALDSGDASMTSWRVQVAESTGRTFGVNDTGASIASSTYFWAMVEGPWVADSTVLGTDVTITAEAPIMLNSDHRVATLVTLATTLNDHPVIGMSLVSIASDATTQTTKTVLIKPQMG